MTDLLLDINGLTKAYPGVVQTTMSPFKFAAAKCMHYLAKMERGKAHWSK